jgi:O-antigen ligase
MMILHLVAIGIILVIILRTLRRGTLPGPRGAPALILVCLAAGLLLATVSALQASYALAAWLGLWDLLLSAGLFAAACITHLDDRRPRLVRNMMIASTTLQAGLAVIRGWHGGAAAAGASFENPNHLAAFLNLGLLLCVSAADACRARSRYGTAAGWLALGALHLVALVQLASRGAFLALGISLVLFVVIGFGRWSRRLRVAAAIGLVLVGALGVASLARRFSAPDPYRYHRVGIWRVSLHMLGERPLLGFGPDMFRHHSSLTKFPLRGAPVRYDRNFDGAHSALLTLAVETGAPALTLLLASAVMTAAVLLRRGDRSDSGGFVTGVGLALIALGVHAAVDDLHHRPALMLLPAMLAGLAMAAAGRGTKDSAEVSVVRIRPGTTRVLLAGTLTACVTLAWGIVVLPYLAHWNAESARSLGRDGLWRMERAVRLNRLHPEYRHDLAMAMLNLGPVDAERYARCTLNLQEARRLKPIDYRFPLLQARLEARVGDKMFDDPGALDRATALYGEAARLAPLDPRPLLEMAAHLSELGRQGEALAALDRALLLEPNFLRAAALKTSILVGVDDIEGARAAFTRLRSSVDGLRDTRPESGYARDILLLEPQELTRLRASLERPADTGRQSSNH